MQICADERHWQKYGPHLPLTFVDLCAPLLVAFRRLVSLACELSKDDGADSNANDASRISRARYCCCCLLLIARFGLGARLNNDL